MGYHLACFGELLLRMGAPGRECLLQTPRLEVHVGGAEANVAVSLARLGNLASMVSIVPDNALGAMAVGELRRHGVDTRGIGTRAGRMGLYFLATGAVHRPSEVLYDRADSAFALTPADAYDWPVLLADADALHLSGVTPAVGPHAAAAAIAAAEFAHARGISVSFDGNFRKKLWDAWDGDAPGILRRIVACADLIFADHRDIAILLGTDFGDADPVQRQQQAARAALAAFPQLARVATTLRVQHSVDHHELSAVLTTRAASVATESYALAPIVDRIGGGDAFAAGMLHALRAGMADRDALRFALAAACLKHSIPGDFNLVGVDAVLAFLDEQRYDVRR